MHTFFLQKPRDLLDMLEFQLHELRGTPSGRSDAVVYRTIQCAITAWQLCDWVFTEMDDAQKVERSFGRAKTARARFQNWVKKMCPALAQCRMLADGAKHGSVTRDPDPGVSTFKVVVADVAPGARSPVWFIGSSEGFSLPAEVIDEGRRFWLELLVNMRLHQRTEAGTQVWDRSRTLRRYFEA